MNTETEILPFSEQDMHNPIEVAAPHYADVCMQVILWLTQNLDPAKVEVRQSGDEDYMSTRILYDGTVVFYGNVSVDVKTHKQVFRRQINGHLRSEIRHFLFENRMGRPD